MTFREKLADWISGGALTRYRRRQDDAHDMYQEAKENYRSGFGKRYEAVIELDKMIAVLYSIVAQEKPTSNATVKRMARMAREALGE